MKKFFIFRKGTTCALHPLGELRASLVWLHGLGGSAEAWARRFLNDSVVPSGVRVVLLTAPTAPVSKNGGEVSTSWFDIAVGEDGKKAYSFPDANANSERVRRQLQEEIDELGDARRVFIGGFSQGAAMSLNVGLEHAGGPLGGILALSGFLFPQTQVLNESQPVLAVHGEEDDRIPLEYATESMRRISALAGFQLVRVPKLAHKVNARVVAHVFNFLEQRLKA